MSGEEVSALARRLEALRQAFDQSFAAPRVPEGGLRETFLVLNLGQSRLALRLAELTGLFKGRRVIFCPTDIPEFLGLAGLRGRLVPVYSLASLLGLPEDPDERGWLAVCRVQEETLGLAFAGLEGTVRASQAELCTGKVEGIRHVREALRLASGMGYIVDLESLKTTLKKRVGIPAGED